MDVTASVSLSVLCLTCGGIAIHKVSLAILATLFISSKSISINFGLRLRRENRPSKGDPKMTENLSAVDD
jgi:hypothetical protein